ncbi:unnamed protein product [Rotaria sordida]|uniref:3'-5' exonuclease domain-containing protein n=1 Tax=Rotaria sordida TaxID=392033 RepID=A0A815H814_9BILA|nr:unnamed protein product [Rotaria sordida]CAF1601716.1 unnamed protein product [Rotaria sordida]
MNRNARKHELNMALSVLPIFNPLNDYRIYHINQLTSSILLHNLIEQAKKTIQFTIDTEDDYYTHRPSLIQIEFIQHQSIVLLIEVHHLPQATSVIFWLIRSLLKIILNPSNCIYSWGNGENELNKFISCGLFSSKQLKQINNIDVQKLFKNWHDQKLTHEYICLPRDIQKRLHAYSKQSIETSGHHWSLQMAIVYACQEFLNKCRTKSRWSRNLYIVNNNQSLVMNAKQNNIIQEMIQYAVNDCLAVTKLVSILLHK